MKSDFIPAILAAWVIFGTCWFTTALAQSAVGDGDLAALPPPAVGEDDGESCGRWTIYWNSPNDVFQGFAFGDAEWMNGYITGKAPYVKAFAKFDSNNKLVSDFLTTAVSQFCLKDPSATTRQAVDATVYAMYPDK